MKKLISVLVALVLVFSMSAVAFADEVVHNGTLPVTSSKDVEITINSIGAPGEDGGLPSEYHARVEWAVQDGVYDVSQAITAGKKLYTWDCTTLNYIAGSDIASEDNSMNWTTKPSVKYEVINASTPDKKIMYSADLTGNDTWRPYMKATFLGDQAKEDVVVNPVTRAKLGSGTASRVDNVGMMVTGTNGANNSGYEYSLTWDYAALNAEAYELWLTGETNIVCTNTFTVTIEAAN